MRLFIEAVVIVASILLAFGIDAWWDGRQERREVRLILEGLESEFLAHRVDLETQLARTDSVVAGLRPLLEGDASAAALSTREINEAATASRRIFDWDVRRGVLDGVVSGGKLSLLDPELQRVLSSWPRLVDDVLDNQQLMQSFELGTIVPALARRHAPFWAGDGFRRDDLNADEQAVYRRVLGDPEVRALLAIKSDHFEGSLDDIRTALQAADQILIQIRRGLDRQS